MIYALNLFDIVPGREATYREYLRRSIQMSREAGVTVTILAAGHKPRGMEGKVRQRFAVVSFPSQAAFDQLYALHEANDLHRLRAESTANYIWTVFDPLHLPEG
jgi:uncharacterized protein (DUF1330 family)